MDDFVKVQIIHPTCNPRGPIHKQPRGDFPPCSQDFVELSMCTVLHDNTVAWGLSANSPVKENTQLVKISEVRVPEQLSKVAIKGQENNLLTLPGQASANTTLLNRKGNVSYMLCTGGTSLMTGVGFLQLPRLQICRVHSMHFVSLHAKCSTGWESRP